MNLKYGIFHAAKILNNQRKPKEKYILRTFHFQLVRFWVRKIKGGRLSFLYWEPLKQ